MRVHGQVRLIDGFHIERHESSPLLVRDHQIAVDIDDVLKSQLARESIRPAERLGREPGQVIDVMRPPLGKQDFQDRVCKDFVVEDFLNPV
jgi:hypothetical protein